MEGVVPHDGGGSNLPSPLLSPLAPIGAAGGTTTVLVDGMMQQGGDAIASVPLDNVFLEERTRAASLETGIDGRVRIQDEREEEQEISNEGQRRSRGSKRDRKGAAKRAANDYEKIQATRTKATRILEKIEQTTTRILENRVKTTRITRLTPAVVSTEFQF